MDTTFSNRIVTHGRKTVCAFVKEHTRPHRNSPRVWSVTAFESRGRYYAVAETEDGHRPERRICQALSEETALARLQEQIDGGIEEVFE
jgi:hypothetical protein